MGNYKAQFLFIFRHCIIWMKMYRISRKSVCQLVICAKTGKFYCSHLNKTANNVNTPLFLNRKIPSTLNTNNLNLIATYRYCSRPFRSIIYTYIYIYHYIAYINICIYYTHYILCSKYYHFVAKYEDKLQTSMEYGTMDYSCLAAQKTLKWLPSIPGIAIS